MSSRRLLIPLVLVLVTLTISTCGDRKSAAPVPCCSTAADQSPGSPNPTEAPWNPIYGYEAGTSTGVAEVDAVMAAISARDIDALAALVLAYSGECTNAAFAPIAYRCPPGNEPGTLVPLVNASFCSGSVVFPLAEVRAILRPLLDGSPRLWGLLELPPGHPSSKRVGSPDSRYVLFVVNSSDPPAVFYLTLGADGLIQHVNYGCNAPPEAAWLAWSTTGTARLSPPPAPRPR